MLAAFGASALLLAIVVERNLLRDLRTAETEIAAGKTYSIEEVRAFVARRAKVKRKRKAKAR